MKKLAAKTGASFYLLWGIIHIIGGVAMLQAAEYNNDFIGMISANINVLLKASPIVEQTVNTIFKYHSFNIIWIGLLSAIIAMTMNWKNSKTGFWFNLLLVGFTDLGLILFMVVPGVMSFSQASPGLLLFLPAVLFSTFAVRQSNTA